MPLSPADVPTKARSQVTWKTSFTVCAAVAASLALAAFLYLTRFAIALTLVAILVAVAMDHGCAALQRRGMKRGFAVAILVTTLLGVIAGIGFLLVPALVSQAKGLAHQAPKLLEKVRHNPMLLQTLRYNLGSEGEATQKVPTSRQELVQGAAKPVAKALGGAVSVLGAVVTVLFLAIFMLVFGGRLVTRMLEETIPDRRERYERVLQKIYTSVGGYIVGLLFICLCNATLTTAFLAITRTPFFLPLGITSGFSSLVPYAGPIVMGASITGVAFATGGVSKALLTAGYFVAYGQLEGNVLGPIVFRRTAHINPLMTMVSVLFFAELAGVAGAILAVPLVAAAQIVVYELLAVRREKLNLPHPERPADPMSGKPRSPEEREHADLHS